jgi:hypothetical protein
MRATAQILVEEERERCAKIAEDPDSLGIDRGSESRTTGRHIAAAIRNRINSKPV